MDAQIKERLTALLEFSKKNNLYEVLWQDGDLKIGFRRCLSVPSLKPISTGESTDAVSAVEGPKETQIFRRANAKNRPPMVVSGDHVKPGDRLGIVECMKIPTEVISVCHGQITNIYAEEGQAVEYGQPLFGILPSAEGAPANK